MSKRCFLAPVLALACLLAAFATALAHGSEEGARLVRDKCTSCHGVEVVCALLGERDQDGWDWIVNEMQRKGAELEVHEKRDIIDYLAGLHPGSPPLCADPEEPMQHAPEGADGEALVMRYCTSCHDTRLICKGLRAKGKDAWDRTVTTMMLKGAAIDSEQKAVIVDYLYQLPAGAKPVCP